jgi:hypothetical protein
VGISRISPAKVGGAAPALVNQSAPSKLERERLTEQQQVKQEVLTLLNETIAKVCISGSSKAAQTASLSKT